MPRGARPRGAAGRPRAADAAPAGRGVGAAGGRRGRLARDGAPHADKNGPEPHSVEQWRPAPTADPTFVRAIEDVLAVRVRPLDPARPVVRLDGTRRRRLADAQPPLPPARGRPARRDRGHVHGGVLNLFLETEPPRGRHGVLASAPRTRLDSVACVRHPADPRYPAAERVVLVLDRPDTRAPAPLSTAAPAAKAARLADRIEIHHTPTHGSRLDIADPGPAVLPRRCLSPCLPDRAATEREAVARPALHNRTPARVPGRFTAADDRTRLRRLYPAFDHGRAVRAIEWRSLSQTQCLRRLVPSR